MRLLSQTKKKNQKEVEKRKNNFFINNYSTIFVKTI